MLSQDQIETIKVTVPVIQEHGNTITQVFYENLLRENPSLNEVFNQGNQATGHQAKALAGAVYAYARNIEHMTVLGPAIERITQKHASLFIQPDQYDIVGKYLLEAFVEVLGDNFTPAIREAWVAAYGQLADTMISAEKKLYDAANGWTTWRDFVIQDKISEADEITSFILKPVDQQPLPSYLPGQYVSVRVQVSSLHMSQARQYSLSDKPASDHYRISVKKDPGLDTRDPDAPSHPGYVSNVLHDEIKTGDIVRVSRPMGEFYLNPKRASQAPVVLISAGVGLTPLMSMLSDLVEGDSTEPVTWIHGAHSTHTQAFRDQLRSHKLSTPSVHKVIFIKNPSSFDRLGDDYQHVGHVDLTKCDEDHELFLNNKSTEYYICGPTKFMQDVEDRLCALGVEKGRIQMEKFGTGDIASSL